MVYHNNTRNCAKRTFGSPSPLTPHFLVQYCSCVGSVYRWTKIFIFYNTSERYYSARDQRREDDDEDFTFSRSSTVVLQQYCTERNRLLLYLPGKGYNASGTAVQSRLVLMLLQFFQEGKEDDECSVMSELCPKLINCVRAPFWLIHSRRGVASFVTR